MSSSGITSINELPSLNNQNGHIQQQMMTQQPQNIILNRSEIVSTNNNQMSTTNYTQLLPTGGATMNNPVMQNGQLTMENSNQNQAPPNYNELISQIQKAAVYGATTMPSRDIPMEPSTVANDVQSQPNYIPPPQIQEDYIKNSATPQNLIETNSRQTNYDAIVDKFYGEFQLPLIIALLYFLFHKNMPKDAIQYNKLLNDETKYYKHYDFTDHNKRDVSGILNTIKTKYKDLELRTYNINFDKTKYDMYEINCDITKYDIHRYITPACSNWIFFN